MFPRNLRGWSPDSKEDGSNVIQNHIVHLCHGKMGEQCQTHLLPRQIYSNPMCHYHGQSYIQKKEEKNNILKPIETPPPPQKNEETDIQYIWPKNKHIEPIWTLRLQRPSAFWGAPLIIVDPPTSTTWSHDVTPHRKGLAEWPPQRPGTKANWPTATPQVSRLRPKGLERTAG